MELQKFNKMVAVAQPALKEMETIILVETNKSCGEKSNSVFF